MLDLVIRGGGHRLVTRFRVEASGKLPRVGSLHGIGLIRAIKIGFPEAKLLLAIDREAQAASGIEADGFFTKPYTFPELIQQIEVLLQPESCA